MYFMEVLILKREFCYCEISLKKRQKASTFTFIFYKMYFYILVLFLALLVLIECPSDAHNGYFLLSVLYKQTHIYQECHPCHTDELCKQP